MDLKNKPREGAPVFDPELLRRAGVAIYGVNWQSPLARRMGISTRTVQRWMAETATPPSGLVAGLVTLLLERGASLDKVREDVEAYHRQCLAHARAEGYSLPSGK